MLMRPLEDDRLRRMVHRGLPGVNMLVPRLAWPGRGSAATIPV